MNLDRVGCYSLFLLFKIVVDSIILFCAKLNTLDDFVAALCSPVLDQPSFVEPEAVLLSIKKVVLHLHDVEVNSDYYYSACMQVIDIVQRVIMINTTNAQFVCFYNFEMIRHSL